MYAPKGLQHVTFFPPSPTQEKACAAVGVEFETLKCETPDEAFAAIKESVDDGHGLQGDYLEMLIFCGYKDAPLPEDRQVYWVCVPFSEGGKWWTWQQFIDGWWDKPWGRVLKRLGDRQAPRDPKKVAVETMQELVRLSKEEYLKEHGALTGITAMEHYAADIADPDKTIQNSDDSNTDSCFFERGWGCFAVYPQWTARECSARYLDRAAPLFDAPVREHMEKAAAAYHEEYVAWQKWETNLGRNHALPAGEGDLDYDRRWADPSRRKAASQAVLEAIEHEKAAIAEVEKALAALGD